MSKSPGPSCFSENEVKAQDFCPFGSMVCQGHQKSKRLERIACSRASCDFLLVETNIYLHTQRAQQISGSVVLICLSVHLCLVYVKSSHCCDSCSYAL